MYINGKRKKCTRLCKTNTMSTKKAKPDKREHKKQLSPDKIPSNQQNQSKALNLPLRTLKNIYFKF